MKPNSKHWPVTQVSENGCAGNMAWTNALPQDVVEESKADDYIRRAITRDPDIWVIEIEDKTYANPFDGKVI